MEAIAEDMVVPSLSPPPVALPRHIDRVAAGVLGACAASCGVNGLGKLASPRPPQATPQPDDPKSRGEKHKKRATSASPSSSKVC